MKRITLISICIFILVCSHTALAQSTLVKIAKADARDISQLFFSFDSLPKHSYKLSNKRIDVLLEGTMFAPDIQLFESDERIIRVVPSAEEGMAVVSLFFRYQPQEAKLETTSDGKLVLEILLGNRDSRSYQDLSERLKGLTVVEEEKIDFSNPLLTSPYAYDWRSFFKNYEPAIQIDVPLKFTAPPFPAIALIPPRLESNIDVLAPEIIETAGSGDWNELAPRILEQLTNTPDAEQQKLLALTYGETLQRAENYEGAYKQLYLLQQQFPDEHVGLMAKYLLILLEAQFRDPYLADFEYKELESRIPATHPLAPYLLISRVEAALATRQFEQARWLLNRDDVPFPGRTQKLRELRQGDYYSGTDQLVKAYVAYRLLDDAAFLKEHPYSLNGYCNTLYRQKKFDQAASCYRDLAPLVSATEPLGLIAYRISMAESHLKPGEELTASFARVENAFAGTEAGSRAAIKQTDLYYLSHADWGTQAAQQYRSIANSSILRPTVAEASFKEALVYSLLGEHGKSIDLLLDFLRDFKVSEIRDSALALLIDILPQEIKRLIAAGRHMEALVLAKKNRELFQNNWLDVSLLADLATAYQKVGIFSEAQRVYLYLLEVSNEERRERFFLPLIESVFDQGEYNMVEDFGSQYHYNYPEGEYSESILILRLRALIASDRFAEARRLVSPPLPQTPALRLLAADIFFHDQEFENCREALEPLIAKNMTLPARNSLMLAESRYQLADYQGAEAIFTTLAANEQFAQQSLYRLAQIERRSGNEENALKLFERIVEKGTDDLWKRYAEREIEYSRLNTSIEKMTDG